MRADTLSRTVLGDSAQNIAQIPPTTEGPGFLLPDSPLFFLDKLKQRIRLFFAFTPEAKAKVYTSVAGERFAELRFMLDRQNRAGIYTDLQGVAENFSGAADQLAMAKLSGKDVSRLARSINIDIKEKQDSLDILEKEETGSLKDEIIATQRSLLESKVKVEESLPAQDLAGEIRDDLNRELGENLDQTNSSILEIQRELNVLAKYLNLGNKESSQAVLVPQQKTVADIQNALEKTQLDIKNMDSLISQLKNESAMAGESAMPSVSPKHK